MLRPAGVGTLSRTMPALVDHCFGSSEPFSIGVEEELFLVDPRTGRQVNNSAVVLDRLGEVQGDHLAGAARLPDRADHRHLYRRPRGGAGTEQAAPRGARHRAGILASGTHPSAAEGDADITHKERYERIHYLLGDAVVTPVGALHVHLGMPDPETAIRVFNGLRRDLPLLIALAANSPFRHGRDTALPARASSRCVSGPVPGRRGRCAASPTSAR